MLHTVDPAFIEKCFYVSKDRDIFDYLVMKLSNEIEDGVQKAVTDSLRSLNEEIASLKGKVMELADMVQTLGKQLLLMTDDLQQYHRSFFPLSLVFIMHAL